MATVTVSSSGHVTTTGLSSFATIGSTGTAKRNWNGSIVVTFTAQPIVALGSTTSPLIPVVSPASLSVQNPPLDALVGHLNVANVPLSAMNISSGDPNHYFAVSPVTQDLRTSPTVQVVSAFYSLGVTATNAAGTSPPAAVSVAVGTVPGAFNDQTNSTFTIQWDAVPTQNTEDAICGIQNGSTNGWDTEACTVRFSSTGNIDARNAAAYAATATVPYTAGSKYHIRMVVRLGNHSYDAYVTPPSGQSEILLASNFAFRDTQSTVTTLNFLGKMLNIGDITLSNMIGPPALPPVAPVVNNATFSLSTSGSGWVAGDVVGTMTASGPPTSWAITAGNVSGYYAISNSGVITVTSAGITGLNNATGTSTLTVLATNSVGNGSGTGTVNYSPTAALSFPDATNTGPTGTLTTYTGPLTISTPQTIQNVIINGTLEVTVNGVTVHNCLINAPGGSSNGIHADQLQVTVDHCEITGGPNGSGGNGILGGGTFSFNNIHNFAVGIQLESGSHSLHDNYIHGQNNGGTGAHCDGVLCIGGQSANITHNTIQEDQPANGTAAILMSTSFGNTGPNIVHNNLLKTVTGYTVYLVTDVNNQSFTDTCTFDGNYMVRGTSAYFAPDPGQNFAHVTATNDFNWNNGNPIPLPDGCNQ